MIINCKTTYMGYGFCFVRISGIDVPAKGDVKAQENDATDFG